MTRALSAMSAALRRVVPVGAARSAALRLSGGTAIAQGLVVVTAPLLTRLYTPAEVGRFGLLASFLTFATVGASLRYDMAIVPASTDAEADHLLVIAGAVTLPVTLVAVGILSVLISQDVLSFGLLPQSSLLLVAILMIATGIFGAVRYWAIRAQEFRAIARATVAQGTARAFVPLAAGAVGMGWWGLVLGEVAARALGIAPLLRNALPRLRATFRTSSLSNYWRTAALNWRYPAVVAPSSLLDALGSVLAVPIVSGAFGQTAAGELLIVQRLASVPATLIGSSVADVFHAHASTLFRERPSELRGSVLRTSARLALIGSAIYIPLGIVSYWGFGLILGDEWTRAGALVALFTPLSIAMLAVSPVTRIYSVVNRPELKLVFDIGLILVPVFAFVVLRARGYDYWTCMSTYVGTHTLAFLVQMMLVVSAAGRAPRSREYQESQ